MARCDTCVNEYDKPIEVSSGGRRHVFDRFECAIQKMAPACAHCQCRIIGHGVESGDDFYCCSHCARSAGHPAATDRVA